jgi:putative cell wall-binding protein
VRALVRLLVVIALVTSIGIAVSTPASGRAHVQLTGADNVASAIAWSQQRFGDGTGTTAVLARADSFADALAGGALAGFVQAPFLVTASGALDDRVDTELDRLGADLVRIIGGTAAIGAAVESRLHELGYDTQRYAGANRIDTAVQVANDAIYDDASTAVLARAFGDGTAGFADSLGGGMLAGTDGAPLLLTETARLSDSTAAYLDATGIRDVVVVGGTAAVSDAVVSELQREGRTVTRIAGANRFATAAAIADRSFDGSDATAAVALVDGVSPNGWVSGFAASVFAGGAILLTNGTDLPDETEAALAAINDGSPRPLLCAPGVASSTCSGADDALNGDAVDGEDVVLADGRLRIPAIDIGDRDLGSLPVGDDLVSRTGAAEGRLFLCSSFPGGGGGAAVEGPWFNGDDTFSLLEKVWVQGEVSWPDARFTSTVQGTTRVLTGNDLPVGHDTGSFPIAPSDPASQYDANPNSIVANDYRVSLPATPTPNATEQCVGGEVGFLLSGVVVNSPVDAEVRDALAHEVQDACQGHPHRAGYHYHTVSLCVDDGDGGHSDLVGYALDGFGIYGTRGENGVVVSNDQLDECHGHTHTITWDGTARSMYHYHSTWEFPYVVGCFRGTNSIQGSPL